jgi:hypothetical protein
VNPYIKALEQLEQRGWWKGSMSDSGIGPKGERCLVVTAVYSGLSLGDLRPLIREMFPDRCLGPSPAHFNCHPDTTLEDVQAVLEKGALRWEEGQI